MIDLLDIYIDLFVALHLLRIYDSPEPDGDMQATKPGAWLFFHEDEGRQ